MRIIPLSILFGLSFVFAVTVARAEDEPVDYYSMGEYKHLKKGFLLPEGVEAEPTEGTLDPNAANDTTALQTLDEVNNPGDALTFEDLVVLYNNKKYDIVSKHLKLMAENGHHPSEELLGIMYQQGNGFPQDSKIALEWLSKAAEAGLPIAEHHLALLYFGGGNNIPADPVRALMWLNIAVLHYQNDTEKSRALKDRDNLYVRLSRGEKDTALELTKVWLDKRGEIHLLDFQ
jgi:hypothetical protein